MNEPAPLMTPFSSVSQLLSWMAKRAAPLAALTLGIASLLWSDFRREFALPIGFASSSVLTALPALTAIVCTAVGCLAAGLAMPAQVLTIPIWSDGPTMASLLQTPIDSVTKRRSNERPSRLIERYWIGTAAASGLGWVGVMTWATLQPDTPIEGPLLLMLAAMLLLTVLAAPVLRRAIEESRPANRAFYGVLLLCHAMQSYISFAAMYILLKTVASVSAWDLVTRIVALIVVMFGVALIQMIIAMRVIKGWYPNLLKHIVCGGLLIMGAIGMVPPIGARVASFALLSSASPDRTCSVLIFNEGIKETPPSAIVDEHRSTQSKPLLVVFPFDGALYVKESPNAPTFVVDAKVLAGTMACPPRGATKPASTPAK